MIHLGLSQLIVAVMLTGVCLVVGLWMWTLWRERRREVHRRRIAVQCRICGCTYAIPKKTQSVTKCPACGSMNARSGLTPI